MTAKHRVGEVGVAFRATFVDQDGAVVSLAGATTLEVRLQDDRGVAKQLTAAFPVGEDGTQGTIEALTSSGTIDRVGWWRWQGHAVGSGWEFYTEIATFEAEANL